MTTLKERIKKPLPKKMIQHEELQKDDNTNVEQREDDKVNVELQKKLQKRDNDTAPDEFLGPDADTDVPLDGSVENDAVLRGEGHMEE
ncbi:MULTISPECIES: hypothetical protein [Niastella]|uniref:Uncharacterized protein n=1 Tax=Niastella soli TaxID=2821487 RepID=A0ABS3Z2U9_9BACT|nr:hypothetical protein [Niastella soli]MBO9204455.1 hypothetical protein [Niastella soli]